MVVLIASAYSLIDESCIDEAVGVHHIASIDHHWLFLTHLLLDQFRGQTEILLMPCKDDDHISFSEHSIDIGMYVYAGIMDHVGVMYRYFTACLQCHIPVWF